LHNLSITALADRLTADKEVLLHSENGILGMGPAPPKGQEDPDLINAGKQPVTLLTDGAMDLAIGAKQVFVMMELLNKQGEPKFVKRCTYPITALRCVSRVYTDHAIFNLADGVATVTELADGVDVDSLRSLILVSLRQG
jgi:3-oxoadipate CoA-transferase beta subunit